MNARDENQRTILIAAAGWGETEIVQLLLKKGADVNAKDARGTTALKAATQNDHADVVQLLKKAGAKE